jgi:hypothetical protein
MSLHDPIRADAGMPPLDPDAPPLSPFEFWPAWAFYAPVWLCIAGLALLHRGLRLPMLANPAFPAGGLVGEEKSKIFGLVKAPHEALIPRWIPVLRTAFDADTQAVVVDAQLQTNGLHYPVVAKPDIGCRGAGVRPIADRAALVHYLSDFPVGETLILQQMVDVIGEAGVFYVREPGAEKGEIISLTLKYFPHVVGDGKRTLRELIHADKRAGRVAHLYLDRFADELVDVLPVGQTKRLVFSGSHSKGAIFRNGNAWITDALRARLDEIADGIPGFHFGRFDIRFADFEAFRAGRDFAIIEINGAGAESTHIWDSKTTLIGAWRALFRQFALLYRIGAMNRTRGHKAESWRDFFGRWRRERRLSRLYPSTE